MTRWTTLCSGLIAKTSRVCEWSCTVHPSNPVTANPTTPTSR
ncbi:Uncharacterised protein [Mycobacteroides abscessus]|nr:Uncharacterised protein [Mycobacteroides abscessus]